MTNKWIKRTSNLYHYVSESDEILASVSQGFHCWSYGSRNFISDTAARAAVEKDFAEVVLNEKH